MRKESYKLWMLSAIILFYSYTQPVYAQDGKEGGSFTWFTETFDGSLRHVSAIGFHEPDRLLKFENRFQLGYRTYFGEHSAVEFEGLAVYDPVYTTENDNSRYNVIVQDERDYQAYAELRKAVLDVTFARPYLRIGKQQVRWGKVEAFPITEYRKSCQPQRNRTGWPF